MFGLGHVAESACNLVHGEGLGGERRQGPGHEIRQQLVEHSPNQPRVACGQVQEIEVEIGDVGAALAYFPLIVRVDCAQFHPPAVASQHLQIAVNERSR